MTDNLFKWTYVIYIWNVLHLNLLFQLANLSLLFSSAGETLLTDIPVSGQLLLIQPPFKNIPNGQSIQQHYCSDIK